MRILKTVPLTLGAILLCATLCPFAKASEEDRKTTVTFDREIQIPGQVLPPGTYVFKLAETQSSRDVVEIWNGDETRLLASLTTNDDYVADSPKNSYFVLDTRDHSSPPKLLSWFYPGDNSGRAFIYPNSHRPRSPEYQPEHSRR